VGAFYTNLTVRGPSRESVIRAIGERPAFVSRTENSCTVVLDKSCESQDTQILSALASELSAQLSCPVLAVFIHDDDVLYYELWEKGGGAAEKTPSCVSQNDTGNWHEHSAYLFLPWASDITMLR
jgi:hypothetical protein